MPLAEHISNLQHLDKNVRIEAALDIGKLADPTAIPALIQRLGSETDFFVRENIVWALVRMGDAAVLPTIDVLQHGDAPVRYHAAHVLSKLGDRRAVAALIEALHDDDSMLSQKAAYALGSLRDVRALPALLELLGADGSEMRSTIHDAITAFGSAAVEPLSHRLGRDARTTAIRVEIVEILGSIGGAEAVAPLAAALQDQAWEVRFAAVNALRRQEDPLTVPALATAIDDVHPHVRSLARRAVQELT